MSQAIKSLIDSGTKLWLDSVDPELVAESVALGATGATSNPIIIADLIKSGKCDVEIRKLKETGLTSSEVAWSITDQLVADAEQAFLPVFLQSEGETGYVSFEVDPLIEDETANLRLDEKVNQYVELSKSWSANHPNRLIKIPATEAGLTALPEVVASGINVNVTLIFSLRQHARAVEAVSQGLERRENKDSLKSVFSIFVSRLDVYTEKHCPNLSAEAQGLVGILNAKRVWAANEAYWSSRPLKLKQEIVFASTGTKKASDAPWKYVSQLAGSDIQTNPPATNKAVELSNEVFSRSIDDSLALSLEQEIDASVNFDDLETTLMREGLAKFAEPQKQLLSLIDSLA